MRQARSVLRSLSLLLAAFAAFAWPSLAQQKPGGTMVMAVQPEPPTLASYMNTSGPIGMVTSKIFDGLLEYDMKLQPIPSLAESWVIAPDGRTITFKIRSGVTFHDGRPLTSADVKFSIMEAAKKTHPRGPNTFRAVTDVETPDANTAVFKLSEPAPYMIMALSSYETPILPKHVYGEGDLRAHPNANSPVGSGPFKFVEWKKGEFIRLDKNPTYWRKGQPYLDRIVARSIPDASTRTAALEKGEVHFAAMGAVPFNDAKKLAALPTLEVTTAGHEMISPVSEVLLNTRKAPLDNVKVRQAIAHAIDRQFIIDNIWFGYGKLATGPMSSNFAPAGLYSDKVKIYQAANGAELAEKLLDEAGFPRKDGGIRFELTQDVLPYGQEWNRDRRISAAGAGQGRHQGLNRLEDVPRWLKRVYTEYDFDITAGFLYNLPDPVLGVHRVAHSSQIKPGTVFVNGSRWSDPKVDALLNQATIETDPKKRGEQYAEFLKLIAEASPIIWVHEMNFPSVINKKYKDVIVSPLGVYSNQAYAWFDK